MLIRNYGKSTSENTNAASAKPKSNTNKGDQQKQLLILNQRYIKDRQLNTKKLAQGSSRNKAGTVAAPSQEELNLGIQRIPTHESKASSKAINSVKQNKVESIKNIYSKANAGGDSYQILQGMTSKGIKMPNHFLNKQGKFENSRNSEMSGLSVGAVSQYSVHKSSKN